MFTLVVTDSVYLTDKCLFGVYIQRTPSLSPSVYFATLQEETQLSFDSYPAGEDEGDDLLKPDPNFSYPLQRRRPKNTPVIINKKTDNKGTSNVGSCCSCLMKTRLK